MQDYESEFDEAPVSNVMQVIALNVVATGAIFSALKISGASWGIALLGGWAGGAVSTVVVLAGAYWLSNLSAAKRNIAEKRPQAGSTQKPEVGVALAALVPANITDPLQMWEADRLMELDHTITQRNRASELGKTGPVSHAALEQMWRDDAAAEAKEAHLTSEKRARSDRRKASGEYDGEERRVAQRRG